LSARPPLVLGGRDLKMDSVSLLVACSLMDSELQERRRNVLQKIRSAVSEVKEIEHGFIYRFPSGAWISELAKGVRSLITSLA